MSTLSVRYSLDPQLPGIVRVTLVGLVVDASLLQFWVALDSPTGAASLVSVFDFRRAVVAYRLPPQLSPGTSRQKPGCFLCGLDQYELLLRRSAQLSALGVRRAVFCSEPLALEWCQEEVQRLERQPPDKQPASQHRPPVRANPCP